MVTYKQSGVNINAGNLLVEMIKKEIKGIGGFAGMFPLKLGGKTVYLVGCTDGVGTKLKLAFEFGMHDGVGVDLVAMNVNDLVCCGATPLFFLDYYATGKLNVKEAYRVIKGIIRGCRESGCALLGGETAEMPGFYQPGEYDLAGFAVGMVEKKDIIDGKDVRSGDLLVALPSSGPHSNGYSLIRKALSKNTMSRYKKELLKPTRIYVKDVQKLKKSKIRIKALCHVTGGGFYDNIPRVLPKSCSALIKTGSWDLPHIFGIIQKEGNVPLKEMYRVFNMGAGLIIAADKRNACALLDVLPEASIIGEIIKGSGEVLIKGIDL